MFDASLDYDDLDWIREHWAGRLIVKGVQTPADAVQAFASGADGIVVSNHGGRQLDRSPVPLRSLPAIREAVGNESEVMVDSGIMTGGEAGVDRALAILKKEMQVAMALLGVQTLDELNPGHVSLAPDRGR